VRDQPAQTAPGEATRFDKLAARYEATIHIAMSSIWLRTLERSR
jgi:transposase